MIKKCVCVICGVEFTAGFDGILPKTNPTCDACAGIEREPDTGYIWIPGETEQIVIDDPLEVTDVAPYTVKRPDNLIRRWRK